MNEPNSTSELVRLMKCAECLQCEAPLPGYCESSVDRLGEFDSSSPFNEERLGAICVACEMADFGWTVELIAIYGDKAEPFLP